MISSRQIVSLDRKVRRAIEGMDIRVVLPVMLSNLDHTLDALPKEAQDAAVDEMIKQLKIRRREANLGFLARIISIWR